MKIRSRFSSERGDGVFKLVTLLAKQSELGARGEGQRVTGLSDRAARSEAAVRRTIAGKALTLETGRGGELGKLSGNLNGGEGASLFETSGGNFDGLIGLQSLVFKSGEIVVVKDGPPFTFAESVLGSAF